MSAQREREHEDGTYRLGGGDHPEIVTRSSVRTQLAAARVDSRDVTIEDDPTIPDAWPEPANDDEPREECGEHPIIPWPDPADRYPA